MTHEAGRQAMDLIPEQLYELTSSMADRGAA